MFDLTGKVAVVTGGASGIGRATALRLARLGAAVAIGDIDEPGAKDAAAEIRSAGGRAISVASDVADVDAVANLIETTVRELGHLDVLVNNAGAVGPDLYPRDLNVVDLDLEVWDRIFAVNLRGVLLGCRFAIPHMIERGGGSIINVSSVDALTGRWGQVAYGVSKGGVNVLTQYVATTYGRQNIRCNAVAPGLIMSPVAVAALSERDLRISAANRPIERAGTPDDIASFIAYLASDESSFMTGQIVAIDGGTLCHHPGYGVAIGGLDLA